ncbi:MAG: outer membrane beta-barrel protein [Endomicrobium sp.]|jgi:hypothetical protein|nr:outer membrane beta-barrel protein [Endomicrobium sp.]
MFKKTFLLVFFLLFLAVKSFAKSELSIWGGYHSVSMDSINDRMISDFKGWDLLGFDIKRDEIHGSTLYLGLDYLFDISETLSVGPRVSFLFVETGNFKTQDVPSPLKLLGVNGERNEEMKTFIVPITIGGKYSKNILDKASIYIKVFTGLGIINAKDSQTTTGNINSSNMIAQLNTYLQRLYPDLPDNFIVAFDQSNWTINETKNCFVLDCALGVNYEFSEVVGIFFDFGYLFTPKTKIQDFTFNFSGLQYAGGLRFKF